MTEPTFENAVHLLNARINIERLQTFEVQDMEGRLEILEAILGQLGHPENAYRTIHVAGTKGKGSTCAMLESILCKENWQVGHYSSPHLYHFTERIRVNGEPISAEEFTKLFFSVYDKIDHNIFQLLTYFEVLTLLAFVYFAQKKVDVAVIETGLGGRLDATNLCKPDVSVITCISYDHLKQLGPTIADIAAEKSGIIKPDVPVVTSVLNPKALEVVRERARSVGSPFFALDENFFIKHSDSLTATKYTFRYDASKQDFPLDLSLDNVTLSLLPGGHQIRNAAAAISAYLLLHHSEDTINPENLRQALQETFLPIRGEIIHWGENSPPIVFDGAHNRSSMGALCRMLEDLFPRKKRKLIFGTSLGKDVEGMFAKISGNFHQIYLTQSSDSVRRFPPQGLWSILSMELASESSPTQKEKIDEGHEDYLDGSITISTTFTDTVTFPVDIDRHLMNVHITENCQDAFKQCLQQSTKDEVICVAGSLYLSAELRRFFQENYLS